MLQATHSVFNTDPYKVCILKKVDIMQIFFANCSHLLIRTQEKKFEDVYMFRIIIACTPTPSNMAGHSNIHQTSNSHRNHKIIRNQVKPFTFKQN